jgi:AcrR family transcriptional regulator
MLAVPRTSTSTDKIIDAASKLFARQGYHGTTTREIAQLAAVGENTIFRQFNDKESLFWSTLKHACSGLQLRRDLEEALARCDPPQFVLPKIIYLLTGIVSYKPELLQLIAVAFLELHWRADLFGKESLSPILSEISRYLETSIKSGKLRGSDPTILTAALMMTPLIHPEISRLIHGGPSPYRSRQDAACAYGKFWADLLTPVSTM